MKKDILFLCQFFYPEHNSSATLPFDTAKYLAANGFTVDALCGYPKEYSSEKNVPLRETKDGVNIRRLRYIQLGRWKKIARLVNYFSFTLSVLLRIFSFRNYRSVIVYSNPPVLPIVAVLANMLFGTKIVFVAYDVYPEVAYASGSLKPGSLIDRGMRFINKLMYERVAKVVALTDEMKEFILANRKGISDDQVVVIPNWAHEKTTVPTPKAYARFGYNPDQFIVSYFGNMGICQEMDTLMDVVEAIKDNEQVRFLFVGHGSKKASIEARIKAQSLTNAQVIDFLTGKDFEQAVAISSCCVVSLEKGLKGMCAPSKYYSYLQGGKPVVAVVEAGSYLEKEIVQEKVGKVACIGDTEALQMQIIQLSQDKAGTRSLALNAHRLYSEKYTRENGIGSYCKLLRTMFGLDK